MGDQIKYSAGASNLGGSLGGADESILADGFSKLSDAEQDSGFVFRLGDDNSGSTFEGDAYAHKQVGVCGRPLGTER